MTQLITITKALADESRLRVLRWLADGELCLCQVVAMLELAPSTVSRHMAILVKSELVQIRKDGKWTYYRLSNAKEPAIIRQTLKWLDNVTQAHDTHKTDTKRLANIRSQDPVRLCELTYGKK